MTTIQEQIAQAKAAGYDDAAITKHLSGLPEYSGKVKTALDAGYQPSDILGYLAPVTATAKRENVQAEPPKTPLGKKRGWLDVPVEAVTNVVPSAIKMGGDIYQAVTSPVQTVKGIAEIATGALLQAAPQPVVDWFNQYGDKEKVKKVMDMAKAVGGMYVDRYGSEEAIKRTIATDPVGFAGDLATLLSGGSTAVGKVGLKGTAMNLAAASDIVNPIKGLGTVAKGVGTTIGALQDIRQIPLQKAAKIAKTSIAGNELDDVVNVLRNAKPGQLPAEVLIEAGFNQPTTQALLSRAPERSADAAKYFSDIIKSQDTVAKNALAKLAGGETATASRNTLTNMKDALNSMTGPQREAALNRGNLGKAVADYEAQAGKLGKEAAAKVQEVRDLINAGNKAEAWAKLQVIKQGLPTSTARYTYANELAEKAFGEWSDKAAQASLDLGQGAKFAGDAADVLRRYGVKPLKGSELSQKIANIADNPAYAGNDVLAVSIKRVVDDIGEWTGSGGVIDLKAMDAIRKNSVNAAVRDLLKGQLPTIQQEAAASAMAKIKPLIDDAIEAAGGTGYKQYLADHAAGMQKISARKLSAEARKLYETAPDQFVKLVENNSPEAVEKIMGKNNYDLAVELSQDAMKTLEGAAKQITTRGEMARQATAGEKALLQLMSDNTTVFKLPNWFSREITTLNRALDIVENKVGKATLEKLTEGAKTAQSFEELLTTLPATERNSVIRAMRDPKTWVPVTKAAPIVGTVGKTIEKANEKANALSNQQNQNALAR